MYIDYTSDGHGGVTRDNYDPDSRRYTSEADSHRDVKEAAQQNAESAGQGEYRPTGQTKFGESKPMTVQSAAAGVAVVGLVVAGPAALVYGAAATASAATATTAAIGEAGLTAYVYAGTASYLAGNAASTALPRLAQAMNQLPAQAQVAAVAAENFVAVRLPQGAQKAKELAYGLSAKLSQLENEKTPAANALNFGIGVLKKYITTEAKMPNGVPKDFFSGDFQKYGAASYESFTKLLGQFR